MHISRVDLNLLVVLETIHAEGGITKAAEKLHLTQPALSHKLARLRELFDDPLFERQGQKMVPTGLTRRLVGPLRESLAELQGLLNGAERFEPAQTRKRFVIGLRDFMESTVMPELMQSVDEEAPNAELASVRVNRHELETELASGAIDLAVDTLLPVSSSTRSARMGIDGLAVVARRAHPQVQGSIDRDGYLAQRHILVSSRRDGPGAEDLALQRIGLQRQVVLRCQFYLGACRTVSQTNLLLTMPERYAHVLAGSFGHQVLPFPAPIPPVDAWLYWHAATDNDPANRWLRERVLASYAP